MDTNNLLDGAQAFPILWRYFLSHLPIQQWLMRSGPQSTSVVSPHHVSQGIGFCCNFSIPQQWSDMSPAFDLGEMFIPNHYYKNFMCGTVVAATSYHKHLVCALGSAASRDPKILPSYRTTVRRMVIDTASTRSINVMEFSWMEDGALIVTTKILVPPNPQSPFQAAGCTGAFALFSNAQPGGYPPEVPQSLVSFVEAPRCSYCTQNGAVSCCCTESAIKETIEASMEQQSSIWSFQSNQLTNPSLDSYYNIRNMLNLISHIAHVKVTAHMVIHLTETRPDGKVFNTYKLGPSRFVIKEVRFRRSNELESDTLRQVADKLRILRCAAMQLATTMAEQAQVVAMQQPATFNSKDIDNNCLYPAGVCSPASQRSTVHSGNSSESSFLGFPCDSCGKYLTLEDGFKCSQCAIIKKRKTVPTKPRPSYHQGAEITAGDSLPVRIPCPRCDKTFSQQGSLNRHLKNIHEERKIPCQFCNMSFGQMFDLKRHQKRKHADRYSSAIYKERTDTRFLRVPVERPLN